MKRILLVLLVLALLPCAFAEEEDWYMETAKELALCVGELAGDTNYLNYMSSSDEIMKIVEEFAAADFSKVLSEYKLLVPADAMVGLAMLADGTGDLSAAAQECMTASVPAMFLNAYNGRGSAMQLAAATVVNFSRTYPMPEGFEACICFLQLDGAAVGVAFAKSGEETITATATPIFNMEDMSGMQIATQLFGALFE